MTKEDKELLLKDLCARLPYGVLCTDNRHGDSKATEIDTENGVVYLFDVDEYVSIEVCRPYLRPMSSMTEEEKEQFYYHVLDLDIDDIKEENGGRLPLPFENSGAGLFLENFYLSDMHHAIDWLNKHYFDYRDLIKRNLALEAPEGMYKT